METINSIDKEYISTLRIDQLLLIYFNLVKYSCDTSYNNIIFII